MITGSRSLSDEGARTVVFEALDFQHEQRPITTLVSGHAEGVDKLAELWAGLRGVEGSACLVWEALRAKEDGMLERVWKPIILRVEVTRAQVSDRPIGEPRRTLARILARRTLCVQSCVSLSVAMAT